MRANIFHFTFLIAGALLWSSCSIQDNTGLDLDDPDLAANESSSSHQGTGSSISNPDNHYSSSSGAQVLSSVSTPSSSGTVTPRPLQPPNPMDTLSSCQWLDAAEYAEPDMYSFVLWNANGVMDTVFTYATSNFAYYSSQPTPLAISSPDIIFVDSAIRYQEPAQSLMVIRVPQPIPTAPTWICPTDSVRWKPQQGIYSLAVIGSDADTGYVGIPYYLEKVTHFSDTIYLNYGPHAQEPLVQPTVRINNAAQLQVQYLTLDPKDPPYYSELSATTSRYDYVVGYWVSSGNSPSPLVVGNFSQSSDPYRGCSPVDPCSGIRISCPIEIIWSGSVQIPHAYYIYPRYSDPEPVGYDPITILPRPIEGPFYLTLHTVTRLGYRDSIPLHGEVLPAPVCAE